MKRGGCLRAAVLVSCAALAACLGPPGYRRAAPWEEAAPAETAPSATKFRLPLENPILLSPFGRRGRGFHTGLDIRRSRRGGEPVMASADGTVADIESRGRYGRQVLLRHSDGWYTRYAHLRSVRVRMGQKVQAGETIGIVGQTGRATGPHLHFEILTPQKRPVDPAPYLFHNK